MLKDKVTKEPEAAKKKRRYQLVEMSDGTLRVRSGWAYVYILPAMARLMYYALMLIRRCCVYTQHRFYVSSGTRAQIVAFLYRAAQ